MTGYRAIMGMQWSLCLKVTAAAPEFYPGGREPNPLVPYVAVSADANAGSLLLNEFILFIFSI